MKYDWLLFDLDNTLMDFNNASKKAFFSMMESYGYLENEDHYDLYHHVNLGVWKEFEEDKIDAITLRSKRFHDFFLAAKIKGLDPLESNRLYLENLVEYSFMLDGAVELLNKLQGKCKLAIITNGLKEVQRPRLKRLDIYKYFDVVVVSDEIGFAKPQKEYFDFVFEQCNYPDKDKTLVIGDGIHSDILGGINYNLPTCWCNLFDQKNETSIHPDFRIETLSDLIPIVF